MTFTHRPLTPDDAQAVAGLIGDYDEFHSGETDGASAQDILDWWRSVDEDGKIGVFDGGRLVGVGTLRPRRDYCIADNFVHPSWRRRGIGEALLRHAFRELYARGARRVALGVDAENTTGATRLYERVGRRVSWQDDAYEKPLQPAGREGGSKLPDA